MYAQFDSGTVSTLLRTGKNKEHLAIVSNDLRFSATTSHGDETAPSRPNWHIAALHWDLGVSLECLAEVIPQSQNGLRDVPLRDAPAPQWTSDTVRFPCRNAMSHVLASGLLGDGANQNRTPQQLADAVHSAVTVITSASSVVSDAAVAFQPVGPRALNASKLPTIAALLSSKSASSAYRFLAVWTPFDAFKGSQYASQRSAPPSSVVRHVDPNRTLAECSVIQPEPSVIVDRSRTHVSAMGGAIELDDSNASSVMQRDIRPEGIAYTVSICRVDGASRHVVVSLDGRFVTVFNGGDVSRDRSEVILLDTARPGMAAAAVRVLRRPQSARGHRPGTSPTVVWASAVPCDARLQCRPSVAFPYPFLIAALLSDWTLATFALHEAVGISSTTTPFSPRDALSGSASLVLEEIGCSISLPSGNSEHRWHTQSVPAPDSITARQSPHGGVIAVTGAAAQGHVLFFPVSDGVQPVVTLLEWVGGSPPVVADLVWAHGGHSSGVYAAGSGNVWWVSITGCGSDSGKGRRLVQKPFVIWKSKAFNDVEHTVTSPLSKKGSTPSFFGQLWKRQEVIPAAVTLQQPRILVSFFSTSERCERLIVVCKNADGSSEVSCDLLCSPPADWSCQLKAFWRSKNFESQLVKLAAVVLRGTGASDVDSSAWGAVVASAPHRNRSSAAHRISAQLCSAYTEALRGIMFVSYQSQCASNQSEAVISTHRLPWVSVGSIHVSRTPFSVPHCRQEIIAMRWHVLDPLAAFGRVSDCLEAADILCKGLKDSCLLAATWELAHAADGGLASICGSQELISFFIPSAAASSNAVSALMECCSDPLNYALTLPCVAAEAAARVSAPQQEAYGAALKQIETQLEAFATSQTSPSVQPQQQPQVVIPCPVVSPEIWDALWLHLVLSRGPQGYETLRKSVLSALTKTPPTSNSAVLTALLENSRVPVAP